MKLKHLFRNIVIAFFLAACSLPSHAADTIKLLILNDVYQNIPAKGEKPEKLGKMKGDLLVMGTRYSGDIEVWKGDKGLYLINELPMEEYIMGVVAAEAGPDWDIEALKAQAVISRTYALFHKTARRDSIYDLTSSVLHQVYKASSSGSKAERAVSETKGEILTFMDKPIEAFFHSTSCESTESSAEVFGKYYPYLQPVESDCSLSPYCVWERKIPMTEIEKALNLNDIQNAKIKSVSATKRARELEIISSTGTTVINATDLRKALGWNRLPSTDFSMSCDKDTIIFDGKGYGHGVGLCQWCSLQMAQEGKNYKEILSVYYPGTTIQLYEGR